MGKQAHSAIYLGLGLVGLGFLVIGLAWNGASELGYVQGQFPYLISGGLTGLGLIVLGAVMLVIHTMRQDGAKRAAQIDALASAMAELQAQIAPGSMDEVGVGEFRPRSRRANGQDSMTEQIPQVVETRRKPRA